MTGLASRAVKAAAVAADVVAGRRRGVVVLLYHRVGGASGLTVDLPTALFAAQVRQLAAGGPVVTLDAALDAMGLPPPSDGPDPVSVTFDDGTADFADLALPVLVEAGVPATVFVATDFVDRGRSFPSSGTPMSWSALSDAVGTGLVTVGSHTHTHALLDRVPREEAAQELDRSIGLIEDNLGQTPRHFAYPKGLLGSPEAQVEVRRRFRSAALGGTRPNPYTRTDPHRVHRSPVQATDGMRYFRRKARGGMWLEDDLRRLANRRRYAGAVT